MTAVAFYDVVRNVVVGYLEVALLRPTTHKQSPLSAPARATNPFANNNTNTIHSTMTSAPTIQPKFLPNRHDLGIVAVGFSGGQVSQPSHRTHLT